MKQNKKWVCLLAAVLAVACLSACTTVQSTADTEAPTDTSGEPSISATYAPSDLEVGYDETGAVKIVCQSDTAAIEGQGASVSDGVLSITQAGTYILSGALDGQIAVQADGQEVQLVLNGLSVTSPDGPAILVKKASKVILTLTDGTQNALADSAGYTLPDGEDEPNACLFSKSDLTINGDGKLTVTGNYNHGIYCKDMLSIVSGALDITAANDGLKGKDCVQILTADLTIEAGGDGIQSNNDSDPELGYIVIEGGSCHINASQDGIQAETVLDISGGDFDVTTGGGSVNAVQQADGTQNPGWGQWGKGAKGGPGAVPGQEAAASESDVSDSAKGLKAGSSLNISGGSFLLDTSDDALHANGSISISAGDFTISTGDDGAHADSSLEISGCRMSILTSYEGLEGQSVTISGGEITLTSLDDGINAAGGSDETAGLDWDFFRGGDTGAAIYITGGSIEISASGDGIDSNGSLLVAGGTVFVSGPTNTGNGALDYATTAQVTGGTVIAAGSQGMAVGFGSDSTQCSFMTSLSSPASGGTEVVVTDSAGTVICRYTPSKSYQNLVISDPALCQGETYTVTAGEQSQSVTLTAVATNSGSGFGGGMDMPGHGGDFGGRGGFGGDQEMPGGTPPEGMPFEDEPVPGGDPAAPNL